MDYTPLPIPYLPLEVKNHILRFCSPSTLAKTAQVSLAFLELSSPILYEDVHIYGFKALKLLFSKRIHQPSLAIAPFLSLSQIRDLTIHLFQADVFSNQDSRDFSLDRSPNHTALYLQRLRFSFEGGLDIKPFSHLFNPTHLIVHATSPSDPLKWIETGKPRWSRLKTVILRSVASEYSRLEDIDRAGWPSLVRVTYEYDREEANLFEELVDIMVTDIPMAKGVEVVVVVGTEDARSYVWRKLRSEFEEGSEALAQVTVQVKE